MFTRITANALAVFKLALAALAFIIVPVAANACTSFTLTATDGSRMYGRTMEFAQLLPTKVGLIPRGYEFASQINEQPGHSWKGKYAVIGASIFDSFALVDGINEHGLSGGALYFPGYAGYKNPADDPKTRANEVSPVDFLTWVLSNFKTVDDVKAGLDQVSLVASFYKPMNEIPPLHYTLHDTEGHSIVIEPMNGEIKVYDNPYSVLTNSPDFEWHTQNIRNYLFLSPFNVDSKDIMGEQLAPFGQGSGLLGIPGDPTPPSRFIRALGFITTVDASDLNKAPLTTMEHVLNNFDIPIGFVRSPTSSESEGKTDDDYTQWTAISDMKAKKFYIKTYENQTLRTVDFEDFDVSGSEMKLIELPAHQPPLPLIPKAP
ncbi:Penicillin acylase precursor [Pseudovibrio axinellae]|uniref:Penicillin acylase n=1 Tax=Pseudovibrio axinellae TaxID=989403 RepID=A0A161V6V2_9HYPH|nr:choloylglycine hydrolase family protein [Pseudovibrio axinellae]KZL20641.1 Penicillin acylase precursor [Pseudovibrio axinellae]SER27099.1 penicillin amidase Cysteine peptidase. MEROPS family C59 [Pseudovibrio axinellae]